MHFLTPQALWLLLLVPFGTLMVLAAWRQRQAALKHYGEPRLVSRSSNTDCLSPQAFGIRTTLVSLGLALAIVAIARPSLENGRTEFARGTVDVIAVVDVSRSMAAEDYRDEIPGDPRPAGTRLNMARHLLLDEVVGALSANRLGIVSYAGQPNSQAFLTDDLPALSFVLQRALVVGSAPGEGSKLAWALARACRLFDLDSSPDHKRVLVLFSDGGIDDKPEQLGYAIRELRKRDVQVVVAGLGSRKATAIPAKNLPEVDRVKHSKWYEVNGKPVTTKLEEKQLQQIARKTGGTYTRVETASDFKLTGLVSGVETVYRSGEQELYMVPLFAALLLLIASLFKGGRRR